MPGSTSTAGSIDGADRHEEHRDQQGRAEELDALHELALVGHQAVERQPAEERADDALDADDLGDDRRRQQGGEHEHVAQRARVPIVRKNHLAIGGSTTNVNATRMARPSTTCTISSIPLASPAVEPEMNARTTSARVSVSTVAPTVGGHGAVAGEAHVAHDRVGDERVRREQRAEQDRPGDAVADEEPAERAEDLRGEERQRHEADRLVAVAGEHAEVELEAGEEHEVQQPDLAELVEDAGGVADDAEHLRGR